MQTTKARQMTDTLTIRQMCDLFAVTPRALRFYEDKQLLAPQRVGQVRHYTPRERARLTLILRGKRFGFSLEDIRQLLAMYDHRGSNQAQLTRTVELAGARLSQMIAQRAELTDAIADLEREIAQARQALAALHAQQQEG